MESFGHIDLKGIISTGGDGEVKLVDQNTGDEIFAVGADKVPAVKQLLTSAARAAVKGDPEHVTVLKPRAKRGSGKDADPAEKPSKDAATK